ncbi:MAG: TonB-dependent receptor [Treponema sp.]|jgi:hypothetical protein|nr:TonB-dependent receptor [Treponema sp.]
MDRTRLGILKAVFFGFGFLFTAAALFGGDITITVTDGDLNIPLEGARVISWDGSELSCDGEGKVRLYAPDDRPVLIRISYPGYEPGVVSVRPGNSVYTAALKLGGGVLEERELVIRASRPGTGESVGGRSVAVSGRDLARQAETGVVEDVMRAVKLLPGVGYVGGYMAMPSVRGGEPSDITAVFDGFYVERPYHWGGAFSIFDPKMVESAQLSHGVFSARYGHTISGLLDISAKRPSRDTAGLDLAVSTSAANVNLSFPLGTGPLGGGVSFMGKVTYWDPFVETAKLFFEEVRYITTAPYIRSAALGASYQFSTDLSFSLNGFFGGDGVAAHYEQYDASSSYRADFSWDNKIGFLTSGIAYSPREDLLIRARLGAGILQSDLNGNIDSRNYAVSPSSEDMRKIFLYDRTVNVQGRFDMDWARGKGFVLSAGAEERYSRWKRDQGTTRLSSSLLAQTFRLDIVNQGFSSSAYAILEYIPENRRFGMELGLRGDHFLLTGNDFTLRGIPALNPRINFDFGILEDQGPVDSFRLNAGTGLFSSINSTLQNIEGRNGIDPWADTQNRSWTSVGGVQADFTGGLSFTLEGYFKYVFNRSYFRSDRNERAADPLWTYFFDGKALIWGFDAMLKKFDSRYWDGWISYSYINARYRDPQSTDRSNNSGGWYYPGFHRFHTLNLIFNYRPVRGVNINTRFSLASGIPIPETTGVFPDPGIAGAPPPYIREQAYSDHSRSGLVIPLDIKLSFFTFNPKGKVMREIYLSFENLLSLLYRPQGTRDFDSNTGKETPGSSVASYDLPIPLLTFGLKWSY